MMNISDAIAKLGGKNTEGVYSVVGRILKVNKSARTCDVEPLNGDAELFDVRLQAVEKLERGLVIFPEKDSEVVVTFLNGQTGFVSQFTEVETIEWNVDKQLLTFDKQGFGLRTEGSDLKEEIDKLLDLNAAILDLLTRFQLMTNTGATVAVMPNIIGELAQMKGKNTAIKRTLGKIIQ